MGRATDNQDFPDQLKSRKTVTVDCFDREPEGRGHPAPSFFQQKGWWGNPWVRVPPSAPSQFLKGIWLSAGVPFFMKSARLAQIWLWRRLRVSLLANLKI